MWSQQSNTGYTNPPLYSVACLYARRCVHATLCRRVAAPLYHNNFLYFTIEFDRVLALVPSDGIGLLHVVPRVPPFIYTHGHLFPAPFLRHLITPSTY